MFKNLKVMIKSIIIISLSLCLIFVNIVSFLTIKDIIYNDFYQLSTKYIQQKSMNFQLYMNYIEETAKQVSNNSYVVKELKNKSNDMNSIIPLLDDLKVCDSNILGVVVYDVSGTKTTSTNISSYPSFKELGSDTSIGKFLTSSEPFIWLVRDTNITDHYGYTKYDEKQGMLTYISKIYNASNNVCAYLLLDININCIYNFFNAKDRAFCKHTETYISTFDKHILLSKSTTFSDDFFSADINEVLYSKTPRSYALSSDKKNIFLFSSNKNLTFYVISAISLEDLHSKLNYLMIGCIFFTFILILLIIYIANKISSSISIPLTSLYNQMNQNNI